MNNAIEANRLYLAETNAKVRPAVVLNMFWLGLLLTFSITPLLSRLEVPAIKLALLLMWVMTSLLIPRGKSLYFPNKMIGWWSFYVLWLFAMCIIGHSNVSINFFIARLPFYAIPFIMVKVLRSYNVRELKLLWRLFLIIFLVNLASNYVIGIRTPELFEQLSALNDDSGVKTNAGGTPFVVLCLFICPIMWIIHQNVNGLLLKVTALVDIILATVFMAFLNTRATALAFWMLMAFLFVLYKWGQGRYFSPQKYFFIIIFGVLLLSIFASAIMDSLMEVFAESERMYERLEQITLVMQGTSIDDSSNGSLGVRIMLSMTSIKTFLSSLPNFLFGVGEDVHGLEIYDLMKYGVGCHSEFFDLPARYGVVGIIIVTNFLIQLFKYIRRFCFQNKTSGMLTVFIVGYILYNFFNVTFDVSMFSLIMLLLPLSLIIIYENKSQLKYEQRKHS